LANRGAEWRQFSQPNAVQSPANLSHAVPLRAKLVGTLNAIGRDDRASTHFIAKGRILMSRLLFSLVLVIAACGCTSVKPRENKFPMGEAKVDLLTDTHFMTAIPNDFGIKRPL
jgi:hypothetical protein